MNKQEYIEQGRQNYKDGGDAFVPAVSWQQRAHNQGWEEARASSPLVKTGEGSGQIEGQAWPPNMPKPMLAKVTQALDTLSNVRGDSQHALRSHAWALVARSQMLTTQGNSARAEGLTEKARRIVSHLMGREL